VAIVNESPFIAGLEEGELLIQGGLVSEKGCKAVVRLRGVVYRPDIG
jgi:hypothetical protein